MPKKTPSDIYDTDKKTGALILGKNRLEDYAQKVLNKFCPEALVKPVALPVEEIIENMGLSIESYPLSQNQDVLGCCMLLDGVVPIYDSGKNTYQDKFFNSGTIIVDVDLKNSNDIGRYRNTLIHEALHWEKDKTYFEILSMRRPDLMSDLYPIMERRSEFHFEPSKNKKSEENQIGWLEWQVHRLAPRLLMPKPTFIKKAEELLNESASCDELIQKLSQFFIVSRSSVKYRLLELDFESNLARYPDYKSVYAEINNRKDFVKISPAEAFELLSHNNALYKWVKTGRFLFADGYFVIANDEFVTYKNNQLSLTKKAKNNLQQCVLNISEICVMDYSHLKNDIYGVTYLFRHCGVSKQILIYHPDFQTNLKDEDKAYGAVAKLLQSAADSDEEKEIYIMVADPEKTICDCLMFLFENRDWDRSIFEEETELDKNYFYKIKSNNMNNITEKILFAICVGLKLPLRITEKLFEKSGRFVDAIRFEEPFNMYLKIMERMPGLPISDFNSILEEQNIEQLGTKRLKD